MTSPNRVSSHGKPAWKPYVNVNVPSKRALFPSYIAHVRRWLPAIIRELYYIR